MVEVLDLEVLDTRWGDYVLPNGIRIRTLPEIIFVDWYEDIEEVPDRYDLEEPLEEDESFMDFRNRMTISVSAPIALRGEPSDGDDYETIEVFEDFTVNQNPRVIYLDGTGAVVFLYCETPEKIDLTDGYDNTGNPIVGVHQEPVLQRTESTGPPAFS